MSNESTPAAPVNAQPDAQAAFASKVAQFEAAERAATPATESNADAIAALEKGTPAERAFAAKVREFEAAERAAAPAAAAPAEPIEPQGTPAERAAAEQIETLTTRLEAGEMLQPNEVPAGALCGYRIPALPPGFGIGVAELEMLAHAREAGIPQYIVDKYVAALGK